MKSTTSLERIAPAELRALLAEPNPPMLIDVRTTPEFRSAHIPEARNLPLDGVSAEAVEERLGAMRSEPIVLVCQSGARAATAARRLGEAGFADLTILDGGTQAWIDAGYSVDRAKTVVLPLMRQVQLVVGVLSLFGAVLAIAVNPWFALVPAVTGAGLTFAGSTGWCGLALLLAKMPWNRGGCCA